MSITTLTVQDVALDGSTLHEMSLDLLTEHITIRELIRSRVYQEVTEFNAHRKQAWSGLVSPAPSKTSPSPNGHPERIEWEAQFQRAVRALEAGTLLIMVDARQVTDLEEQITVTPKTSVSFLRLVPLVGG